MMKIGAQLYTVREFTKTEEDFANTMQKIANIGYSCVQISAIGDISAKKVRNIADSVGLNIVLTHTKPEKILNETQQVIEEHKTMGAHYVGLGSMPERYRGSREGVLAFIHDFTVPAKQFKDAGLQFMYHNHHFEFEKLEGKLCLDYLIEGFSKELCGFVLDTYWVQAGGSDPAFYLKKLTGRVDTIHLKDMMIVKNEDGKGVRQIMSEVLEGNLNWESIFSVCKTCGTQYAFVEQDNCNGKDPFLCLETSYNHLKAYGFN